MKYTLILLTFVICFTTANSQTKITLAEVPAHIGDSVTVSGNVVSGKYFSNSTNAPTLLNLGAEYPNQQLTVVIYDEVRKTFEEAPDKYFTGKTIIVTGKIVIYKEKPQIVIYQKSQLSELPK